MCVGWGGVRGSEALMLGVAAGGGVGFGVGWGGLVGRLLV